MEKYYLAYGSNLNLNHMLRRCPGAMPLGKTFIKDYRLIYKGSRKNRAYLTIEKCEGAEVPVGIYKIDILDENKLDTYEGFPTLYYKEYIDIELNGEIIKALIYIMNDNYDYNLPSFEYIEICREGYADFQIDNIYLSDALKNTLSNLSKKLTK